MPDGGGDERIGAGTFGAKDIRLGVIGGVVENILSLPQIKDGEVAAVVGAAAAMADMARGMNAWFPDDVEMPQRQAALDVLIMVDGAIDIAVGEKGFYERGFVIDLAIDMARKICRLAAAKDLGYSSSQIPQGYYDTFVEEAKPVLDPLIRACDRMVGGGWEGLLEKHRVKEQQRLEADIRDLEEERSQRRSA